jgi:hypothetical protein
VYLLLLECDECRLVLGLERAADIGSLMKTLRLPSREALRIDGAESHIIFSCSIARPDPVIVHGSVLCVLDYFVYVSEEIFAGYYCALGKP